MKVSTASLLLWVTPSSVVSALNNVPSFSVALTGSKSAKTPAPSPIWANTDECTDLGEVAAQIIAHDYCPFNAAGTYGHHHHDYLKDCRSVAYGICKGAIYDNVIGNGCGDITTSELLALQNECEGQVDSMTGGAKVASENEVLVEEEGIRGKKSRNRSRNSEDYDCNGDFYTGVDLGMKVAEKYWEHFESCFKIDDYEESVEAILERRYVTDTDDWRKNNCHEGVHAGAEQVMKKKEDMCNDATAECYELGVEAAKQIAFMFCPYSESGTYTSPDFLAACRSVAYPVCEENVAKYAERNGCLPSSSDIEGMQGKCKAKVDSMTGGDEVVTQVSRHLRTN